MSRTKLTKSLIDETAPGERDVIVMDAALAGFGLKVTPAGKKVFFFRYRVGGRGSKERKVTIGAFGALTLDEARRQARALAGQRAVGGDPAREMMLEQKARERAARVETETKCADLVTAYVEAKRSRTKSAASEERFLKHDFVATFGQTPIGDVTRMELVDLIDRVERRAPSTARNLFAALRPFYKWCARKGYIEASPLTDVTAPKPGKARARVLSDEELRRVWIGAGNLGWPFSPIFRLLILTGQRRSEVAGMRWSELDVDQALWTIPGERVKNGVSHVLHLSPLALEIIGDQKETGEFVFSTTGRSAPSGFSRAQGRLVALAQAVAPRDPSCASFAPWTAHDLRRTMATGLAALGVEPHVTERVLNHVSGTRAGILGVYQRHDYREQRKAAVLNWERHVRRVVGLSVMAAKVDVQPVALASINASLEA
jgi:integrase